MYSIFLVEDEVVVREGVRRLISWEEYGFTFAGEAADGEMAWPLIKKCMPDAVITDIKMPFMDGLALSKLIKRNFPDTLVIILSGYGDFSYAREAIAIGVSQYVLKPVSKDQLVEILIGAREQLDKIAEQKKYRQQFASEVQAYLSSSRRGLFDSIMSGKTPVPDILERAQKLGLDLTTERYNLLLLLLEEEFSHERYSSTLAAVQESVETEFAEDGRCVMFGAGIDVTAFLILADEATIADETERVRNRLTELCEPLGRKNLPRMAVAGKPVARLSDIPKAYRTVRKKLFLSSGARVSTGGADDDAFDPLAVSSDKVDRRVIENFIVNGLPEEVVGFVDGYYKSFGPGASDSEMFTHYLILSTRFTVNSFLENLGYGEDEIGGPVPATDADADGGKGYIAGLLAGAIRLRDTSAKNRYKKMLKKVRDFLDENYGDPDIGLNDAAKVANVSTTHFSALFSQQMGKTFVEYLTEIR
ncbi:MAG: response regulator, partial [Clostridiales Family XIII bacterium]|nr:response regulator [Clostridiales Family XIII bacterium]